MRHSRHSLQKSFPTIRFTRKENIFVDASVFFKVLFEASQISTPALEGRRWRNSPPLYSFASLSPSLTPSTPSCARTTPPPLPLLASAACFNISSPPYPNTTHDVRTPTFSQFVWRARTQRSVDLSCCFFFFSRSWPRS